MPRMSIESERPIMAPSVCSFEPNTVARYAFTNKSSDNFLKARIKALQYIQCLAILQ